MEEYLHICLNSVLKQTYQDFEIICIDDASSDSSLDILKFFSNKDSRVKIVKNKINKGKGYSKNQGLNIAQGEYIIFLDADDWFSFDAFENLVVLMDDNNLDLLLFNNIIYDEQAHDFKIEGYYNDSFSDKFMNKIFNHFDLDKSCLFNIPADSGHKIYSKSFLDKNNIYFPDENIVYTDSPFFYKAMIFAEKISLIDNRFYIKRKKANSTSNLNKRVFDNINLSYLIFNVFHKDFQLYQYYKRDLLFHIFQKILNGTYEMLNKKSKETFYIEVQTMYKHFIKDHDLYGDILANVDKSILDKFNFEDILNETFIYEPKVSIIIPVYNADEFLKRCIDSVINQSLEDIEIICINDGSYDRSLDILNDFRNKDFRVNVFSQKNSGAGLARNSGIEKAKGEYVLFVDSDDFIEPNMCEELYNHAKYLDSDLVLFDATEHNLNNESRNRIYFPNNSFNENYNEFTFDYGFNKKLVLNHFLVVWSKMYKTDLVKNIEFQDIPIFEDVSFHVKSMLLSNKISYFPNLFYHYMKLNTKSEQNFKVKTDKSLCLIDVFKEIYVFLIEKGYFNEFQINFLIFIFNESRNLFDKIDRDYKLILFENIKLFYNSLNINLDLLDEVPFDLSEFFLNILNSENYFEFQCLQEYSNIKLNNK